MYPESAGPAAPTPSSAVPAQAGPPRRRSTTLDLALIAAFAALTAVLGIVAVPVGGAGVPVVLQNTAVILTAMLLGARRGTLSVLLFVGVGLLGVPNLAGGHPTLAALSGPTVGYIVGYILCAPLVGFLAGPALRGLARAGRSRSATVPRAGVVLLAGVLGVVVQYVCGAAGLVARTSLFPGAALLSNTPFIPGDAVKIVVATVIAVGVVRAVPDLLPPSLPRRRSPAPPSSPTGARRDDR
ncbi:biotin transport system substrate-specific component [Corynebacterium bovis DSM 20582 = CIP 54.80]|uniref:Biotin transport system substrate-specific component n=1 Tax=Corynebacterium bovis DSM 20582 = CIP 54.80 TaxID=927655 RepID=A0A8H9Y882_9CORY|nr:biotin transporter BioY [Corynebacterium bovis]MBB3116569.1 biotin transport system substrate-specific component [Corynebacterium bovis DSM 20582 = CIP 54.80]